MLETRTTRDFGSLIKSLASKLSTPGCLSCSIPRILRIANPARRHLLDGEITTFIPFLHVSSESKALRRCYPQAPTSIVCLPYPPTSSALYIQYHPVHLAEPIKMT